MSNFFFCLSLPLNRNQHKHLLLPDPVQGNLGTCPNQIHQMISHDIYYYPHVIIEENETESNVHRFKR